MDSRLALVIESDLNAVAQMRRVLAGMGMRAFAVADQDGLDRVVASLPSAPSLVIARVALPSGSGIRMLEETCAKFPDAGCLLVSHHPLTLLMSAPGFARHAANFLQAEFTDDQFRAAVERALPRSAQSAV